MNNPPSMDLSTILPFLLEKQREEEEQLILLFNEQLRQALSVHRTRGTTALLRIIEINASEALRLRDVQIQAANLKTQELEYNLYLANQAVNAFQNIVVEKMATISSLQATLRRMTEPCSSSCVGESTARLTCKFCQSQKACMVLLPCAHLCACKACEAVTELCPVCSATKHDSVEARFADEDV